MSRALTAQDRSVLIKLAASMAPGSEERRAILAGLTSNGNEKISAELLPCPNCMGAGEIRDYGKDGRALYNMVKCTDCRGKGMVSPGQLTAIQRNIDKMAATKTAYDKNSVLADMILKAVKSLTGGGVVRIDKPWQNQVMIERSTKIWEAYYDALPEDDYDEKGLEKASAIMDKKINAVAATLTKKIGVPFTVNISLTNDQKESIGFNVDTEALRAKLPKFSADEIADHAIAASEVAAEAIVQSLVASGHDSMNANKASQAVAKTKLADVIADALLAKN